MQAELESRGSARVQHEADVSELRAGLRTLQARVVELETMHEARLAQLHTAHSAEVARLEGLNHAKDSELHRIGLEVTACVLSSLTH